MKSGWVTKRLGEVCEIVGGTTPSTSNDLYWSGDNNWITPAEIGSTLYVKESVRKITDVAVRECALRQMPRGTVIFSSRAPIGKVAIADMEFYCNQGFKNCICGAELYNKFLYYFLVWKHDDLVALGTGTTFKELSKSSFSRVEVRFPSLPEQRRIVAKIDAAFAKIDRLKANAEKNRTNTKELFQSALNEAMRPKPGWVEKRLGEVCDLKAGGDKPKLFSKDKTDKLTAPVISNGVENDGVCGYTDSAVVFDHCVTVSARGTIGWPFVRRSPFVPIVRLITAIPQKEILLEFLYYLIKTLPIEHSGSSIPQLTVPMIRDAKVAFPAIEFQRSVIEMLNNVDGTVMSLQQNYTRLIADCAEMRQAVLKEAFEGKL